MKKYYSSFLAFSLIILSSGIFAQSRNSGSEAIKQELTNWDPVRGEWLANSMIAISNQTAIPDRNFPENVSPQELYVAVPQDVRERISQRAANEVQNAQSPNERTQWQRIQEFSSRPGCQPVTGRTYGDPHLKSFDGASYSFQTVGEFILTKSTDGNMEVQVRQQPQKDDFSLNTAVAMNVSGDRVSVYTSSMDTRAFRSLLHVNGEEVMMDNGDFFLSRGGIVRKRAKGYDVIWPTGEKVLIDQRNSGSMQFFNVSVQIYPCNQSYDGILGNANGMKQDDFDLRGNSSRPSNLVYQSFGSGPMNGSQAAMEKEYLAYLAKDFARAWRITPQTSLFDYAFDQSTYTFTDETFPRVHHTLADLNPSTRDNARRRCEEQGIRGDELSGCIYDQGFLNIEPQVGRTYKNPLDTTRLGRVDNPRPNVNRVPTVRTQQISNEREIIKTEAKPLKESGLIQTREVKPVIETQTKPGKIVEENQTVKEPAKPQKEIKKPAVIEKPVENKEPVVAPSQPVIKKPVEKQPEVKPEAKPEIKKPVTRPSIQKPKPKPEVKKPVVKPETKKPAPVITTPPPSPAPRSGGR